MDGNAGFQVLDYRLVEVLKPQRQWRGCLLVGRQWDVVSVVQRTGIERIRGLLGESRFHRHFESFVVF